MTESKAIEGETKKNRKIRKEMSPKMQAIADLKADTITSIVAKKVSVHSELITVDSTSYVGLKDIVDHHVAHVIPKDKIGVVLPWVHIAISNAKRMLLHITMILIRNIYRTTLMSFCYNFNRRYFGEVLFERLLTASISNKNHFRYN